jgi:xanthine dehydrogenase accessory factor
MLKVLIRGGGDVASGIAVRLHHTGIKVIITEIPRPLALRRYVSFAEAVYSNSVIIEEISGNLVQSIPEIINCHKVGNIPVVVDEDLVICSKLAVSAVIDARMLKKGVRIFDDPTCLKIGIGPGFLPGENCDCVVESKRGPFLGRVYWNNSVENDSGIPEIVGGFERERVLRSPLEGLFKAYARIGDLVEKGEALAEVNGQKITAPLQGIVRGLLHDGLQVTTNMKVGDIDPRSDPMLCSIVSDKALAIGGGVLEALLSLSENRSKLSAQA